MHTFSAGIVGAALVCTQVVAAQEESAFREGMMSLAEQRAMVEDYCLMCHSDAALTGGLTLESFDASELGRDTEVAEKMLRKLRTGMMPPSYASRPDRAEVRSLQRRARVEGSTELTSRAPTPDGETSSVSTAPNIGAQSPTCSRSTSTSPRSCRPTR